MNCKYLTDLIHPNIFKPTCHVDYRIYPSTKSQLHSGLVRQLQTVFHPYYIEQLINRGSCQLFIRRADACINCMQVWRSDTFYWLVAASRLVKIHRNFVYRESNPGPPSSPSRTAVSPLHIRLVYAVLPQNYTRITDRNLSLCYFKACFGT